MEHADAPTRAARADEQLGGHPQRDERRSCRDPLAQRQVDSGFECGLGRLPVATVESGPDVADQKLGALSLVEILVVQPSAKLRRGVDIPTP